MNTIIYLKFGQLIFYFVWLICSVLVWFNLADAFSGRSVELWISGLIVVIIFIKLLDWVDDMIKLISKQIKKKRK